MFACKLFRISPSLSILDVVLYFLVGPLREVLVITYHDQEESQPIRNAETENRVHRLFCIHR